MAQTQNGLRDEDDQWLLVPAFLEAHGLVKQHIASYNYFVDTELREIVAANARIESDVDPHFFLDYTDVRVGLPMLREQLIESHGVTPQECRLRDLTYAAPILVDVRYTRGRSQVVIKTGVEIGRMPVMLRSSHCTLAQGAVPRDTLLSDMVASESRDLVRVASGRANRNAAIAPGATQRERFFAAKNECPLDPGGYFVVRGVEKVILVQEQLSKNRILVDLDRRGFVCAQVTSSTHERKSKTYVALRAGGRLYLRHNSLAEDVPLVVALRALGIVSDLEAVHLVCCPAADAPSGGVESGCDSKSGSDSTRSSQSGNDATRSSQSSNDATRSSRSERDATRSSQSGNDATRSSQSGNNATHPNAQNDNDTQNTQEDEEEDVDETEIARAFAPSLEEAAQLRVHTTAQALEYIGARVRVAKRPSGPPAMPGTRAAGAPAFAERPARSHADEARELLADIVLAHVPTHALHGLHPKALYLCLMARRVLHASVVRTRAGAGPADALALDDRDYVGNKRLELAGQLLGLLFEDLFKRFNAELKRNVDRALARPNRTSEFDALSALSLQTTLISAGLERAISTGTWAVRRFRMERAGITQVLSRLSYAAALGMMTRISSQFEKTRKVSGPRALQPSQWGVLCPADTPEGEACGLVKNLALATHVTTDSAEAPVRAALAALGAEDVHVTAPGGALHARGVHVIQLNGVPVGATRCALRVASRLRLLRRSGVLDAFVSVALSERSRTLHVSCDGGRVCRPLLVAGAVSVSEAACDRSADESLSSGPDSHFNMRAFRDSGHNEDQPSPDRRVNGVLLTREMIKRVARGEMAFGDLLRAGVVEYLDVNEENDALIALSRREVRPETTHVEAAPFCVLGAVAGLIPFPHHNQSPRNTYQCAMGKQAMGASGYGATERMDTLLYTLGAPQRPLVHTRALRLVRYDRLPAGQNAVVAVMSYSGYDVEDALVVNRASLDRGLGRCGVLRKASALVRRYGGAGGADRLVAPEPGAKAYAAWRAEALDADGLAAPGERLQSGQILINRHVPDAGTGNGIGEAASYFSPTAESAGRPAPVCHRGAAPAVVERVLLSSTAGEALLVKTLLRQTRRPELGDKFSSRHGQKGVVGLVAPAEDLPFSDDGVVPDIIMNPHGFPSRMTVGKMLELLTGKAAVLSGTFADGSVFADGQAAVAAASETLLRAGFSYAGKDYLTCGTSGEPHAAFVFFGPVFYQKLKHMVVDKMHARARGPRAVLTRQPTEGRSRDGGLRLGEMERDCLIGYGAAALLTERLVGASDAFDVDVCEACGLLGYAGWCALCRSGASVASLRVPYACKLLFQELQSMNIVPRLTLSDE